MQRVCTKHISEDMSTLTINDSFFFSAIYFYRQAVQLVPDIEFRIKDFANHNFTSGMEQRLYLPTEEV